ncbi:ABC transporter permease [Acetonema longum]|uniref:Binding-protein-dependent transporters inner membrane component n=1 Tax=Acetonema longum DSM 6540 TaxID=1009370 RepID=F7NDF4_9FIRM|nr:ABC transporter permease [Acetonema longum]EGO65907.1 binding-protein-dependent transporters inner membrane component [Acetonema longum DSM 6540]
MLAFIVRRFMSTLVVLFVIITATFLLMHSIPGGPFTAERNLPPAVLKNIEERYHLNDPLGKQYIDYITNMLQGDLGPSFKYESRTVNEIIAEGFPVSAELGVLAVGLAVLLGIPAGIISALKHNQWPDYLAMFLGTIGISVPNFILSTLFIYIFALKLELLPAAMWGGLEYMVLPAFALAGLPTAFIARLTRSSMLEVLGQDYIRTARAKGLSKWLIVYRHALKNALIPVVTYLGPLIAAVFTGSFVIETIFAIPGLGRHFVTSIYNRDYTVILGVTVFYSALLVFLNFLVDMAYIWLDPRIKLDTGKEE